MRKVWRFSHEKCCFGIINEMRTGLIFFQSIFKKLNFLNCPHHYSIQNLSLIDRRGGKGREVKKRERRGEKGGKWREGEGWRGMEREGRKGDGKRSEGEQREV